MNCTTLQELAAAHALGALDSAEAAMLEAALAQDVAARVEVAASHDAVAALALASLAPMQPPPQVRAAILQRVGSRPPDRRADPVPPVPPGFQFVWQDDSGWQTSPLPGIRFKLLSISRDMGYQVRLVELAPGTKFPGHDHASSEDLFVISGNLRTEGRLLGPRDFLHAEPGTHHDELISPDGCVALLIDRGPVPA